MDDDLSTNENPDGLPFDPAMPEAGTEPDEDLLPGSRNSPSALAPVITDTPDELAEKPRLPFNVVGIGASAGGVEAYIDLLDHLPSDTGMAYVLVLHLSADQKSHLSEILARHTQMPVEEVGSSTQVLSNHVYVAPAKAMLRLSGGVLQLVTPDHQSHQRAIDFFFYSLAADQKNRAIGIVLSGMDSDGALGLRAIKGEGGITMVQAPETAQYPDMPRSSISADHVDIVSSPTSIAFQLGQLARQSLDTNLRLLEDGVPTGEDQQFARILSMLRGVSGVDFRLYKPSTIRRRIARRLLLHRIDTLREYVAFLQANPNELRELQEDALINVTRFFRDPEVYEAFKTSFLPRILDDRDPSQQVRIWVAGCSTGEEVYSLAMCLLEHLSGTEIEPPIQIFGTDASESNIQKARTGTYPDTITADVSQERLRRFFLKTDKGYQVAKRVRDLCIFARQNLCHDPPFSRMDIISCRNVLIYFGAELQRQLIPTFHYALRPEGYLILGTSETIREFTDLFNLADRRHKIYSRSPSSSPRALLEVVPRVLFPDHATPRPAPVTDNWGDIELQRAADRIMLARYAPPGVVINDRLEILQSRGRTSPFLELRPGAATLDLLRMTRDSIAPQVSAAVHRAIEDDLPVQVEGLRVVEGEISREATLEVLPIHSISHRSKSYLVVFAAPRTQTERDHEVIDVSPVLSTKEKDRLIVQMRHDLSSTRLNLQSLLEERDAKNQELVSANEEIQSANEELQSTNEELETTKEELQSSNEELHTVNDELQNRNTVLTQASNDLLNLLNSVNLPVLMLSNELNIRHFTPPTQRVMNLRAADVGRPFSELRINLDVGDLTPLLSEVLDTLAAREIEVQDREGHWYLLRVRPYRTADNKIEGLIVALVDIDQLRRSQQELRAARDFSRSVIQGVPLPLAVVDVELKIRATNKAFCTLTRLVNGDLERRHLPSLASTLWGLGDPFSERLEALKNSQTVGENIEFEHVTPGETARVFCIRGCVLQPDGEQYLLVTVEDITAHKEAERLLKSDRERLASEVEVKTQALGRSQDELRALTVSLFTSQEEERRRIARELHDDISQRLAGIEIDGDRLEKDLPAGPSEAMAAIQRMRTQIAKLSEDVRLMSHRLHPSIIEDLGLKAALQSLTEEFGLRENMIATFSSRNVPETLPLEVATSLYRIAQEALRNVSKHAGQTHARVSLTGMPDGVQLQIADFGHGFDVQDERPGLGLLSMEERARHIGAGLDINSALGEGTRVTITVPLRKT
jgi:two-component system CheB/CheR fusion protein